MLSQTLYLCYFASFQNVLAYVVNY